MANPSSKFLLPTFSGEGFRLWSRKKKKYLEYIGSWYLIDGEGKAEPSIGPNDVEARAYDQDLLNDRTALMLIHKSLSPNIFATIFSARTTVEAWDLLHQKFESNSEPAKNSEQNVRCLRKRKRNDAPPVAEPARTVEQNVRCLRKRKRNDDLPAPEPARTPEQNVRCLREIKRNDAPPDSEQARSLEQNVRGFRRRKTNDAPRAPGPARTPEQNVRCLRERKIAQSEENSMKAILGSTTGKIYEVIFTGKEELKGVGQGWRRFVADHNLMVGDQLTIDVTEHSKTGQEFTVNLRRCTSSAQLQEESSKRQSHQNASSNCMDDENDGDTNDHDVNGVRRCTVVIDKDDIGDDEVYGGNAEVEDDDK